MSEYDILVGYDIETNCVGEIRLDLQTHVHGAIVGQSGSGKSIALLWLLYQMLSINAPLELYVCDPKHSGDFDGIVPRDHFATGMLASAELIHKYYGIFQNTPENNNVLQLLLVDEYAGLVTSLSDVIGGKDGKTEVEKIKSEMAAMFMLSRSRGMGIWLIMQRPSATLFSSSSGSLDNMMFILNMGKMHTQTHISLFANETLENADFAALYRPNTGSGYFLQDGQPLKAIRIPLISDKAALIKLLQKKARKKFGDF